ncbi:glycine receptor subunit alpha-2 [Caerostris darwini]|uniref:Glycine receptor subunit alpha-2 n=1 Tax=Caerostris darwini TaxID=1538125 RepID=A0AAV4SHG1_9ARAC|nr:glycine receptor subunit alpha-2 [Caerostris darwini]
MKFIIPLLLRGSQTSGGKVSYTTDDLIFDWEEEVPLVVDDSIELPQHNLVDTTLGDCTKHYSTGNFTCIQVVFTLKRRLGYYMFHTYIPTCLIVIMSWISFWIKPEAVPARVTLCVTSLLTLSTQHAQSQKSLPPVSYIKAIDIFMSSCTVFVFASLMEYALVNILLGEGGEDYDEDGRRPQQQQQQQQPPRNSIPKSSRNVVIVPKIQESSPPLPNGTKPKLISSVYRHNRHRHRAILVDKISRVIFPLSFVILNTAYWSVYLDTVDGPLVL